MTQSMTVGQPGRTAEAKMEKRNETRKATTAAKKKTAAAAAPKKARPGLTLPRVFTRPGHDPIAEVTWERRTSVITNPDGSVVFKLEGAEVPAGWSQLATDIVVSKYFRKSGLYGHKEMGETSVAQVVERVARTIREAGENFGSYFATKADADTFQAELTFMLLNQYGAFNSPVWFNCGLWHRYQISGSGGNYAWNPETNQIFETTNAYEQPQCSACFIQKVEDDLMSIYGLVKTEARLFKYGSGTGTNFSALRGTPGEALRWRNELRLDELPSRCSTAQLAPPSRAAPRAEPPRWSASTWITPRSRTSSSGRSARRKRPARSSLRATRPTSTARPTRRSAARTRTTACA